MTTQQLMSVLDICLTNYNRAADETIAALWELYFVSLDYNQFKKAVINVCASNQFFPNASEMLSEYKRLIKQEKDAINEQKKARSRALTDKQAYCPLCDNSGWCFYDKNGYDTVARCTCLHGHDLNKFSEGNLNRDNKYYMPDIKDVLKDELPVYEAIKRDEWMTRKNMTDADKVKALRGMMDLYAMPKLDYEPLPGVVKSAGA